MSQKYQRGDDWQIWLGVDQDELGPPETHLFGGLTSGHKTLIHAAIPPYQSTHTHSRQRCDRASRLTCGSPAPPAQPIISSAAYSYTAAPAAAASAASSAASSAAAASAARWACASRAAVAATFASSPE